MNSVQIGEFIFRHKCRDWAEVYGVALRLLGEEAREQWDAGDVVETVYRVLVRGLDV